MNERRTMKVSRGFADQWAARSGHLHMRSLPRRNSRLGATRSPSPLAPRDASGGELFCEQGCYGAERCECDVSSRPCGDD